MSLRALKVPLFWFLTDTLGLPLAFHCQTVSNFWFLSVCCYVPRTHAHVYIRARIRERTSHAHVTRASHAYVARVRRTRAGPSLHLILLAITGGNIVVWTFFKYMYYKGFLWKKSFFKGENFFQIIDYLLFLSMSYIKKTKIVKIVFRNLWIFTYKSIT